jgi:hypothetical protein
MRKNEASWSESQQRWQIKIQVDTQRCMFVSSKKNSQPDNKKGKIEAEKKADAWLNDRTADEKIRVEKAFAKFIALLRYRELVTIIANMKNTGATGYFP